MFGWMRRVDVLVGRESKRESFTRIKFFLVQFTVKQVCNVVRLCVRVFVVGENYRASPFFSFLVRVEVSRVCLKPRESESSAGLKFVNISAIATTITDATPVFLPALIVVPVSHWTKGPRRRYIIVAYRSVSGRHTVATL